MNNTLCYGTPTCLGLLEMMTTFLWKGALGNWNNLMKRNEGWGCPANPNPAPNPDTDPDPDPDPDPNPEDEASKHARV